MRTLRSIDGRLLCVAIVAFYLVTLGLGGPVETLRIRWRQAGVYAMTPTFLDLRIFPAARGAFARGADPYLANPADPMQRSYNYPRIWLTFMRFPDRNAVIDIIGVSVALAALAALLCFWGRLGVGSGIYGGMLLCTPAMMLGVERGNTDLVVLVVAILGLAAISRGTSPGRVGLCSALWLFAAALKLFPILVLGALPARSVRAWLRTVLLPLAIFGIYLVATASDVSAILRNTGTGWVQAYGARVPVLAAEQMFPIHGLAPFDGARWEMITTAVCLVGFCGAGIWGWRMNRVATNPLDERISPATLAGFRAGALIYIGTFLAGFNFDYRQCFLLLTLPQLFRWHATAGELRAPAIFTLITLPVSSGVNFLLAGWPGFFINEVAGALLGCSLVLLLLASWHNPHEVSEVRILYPARTSRSSSGD